MDEYCITIFGIALDSEESTEIAHAHYDAPTPAHALELMVRQCLEENVDLSAAVGVVLEMHLPTPPGMLASYERLRVALHPVAGLQHLH